MRASKNKWTCLLIVQICVDYFIYIWMQHHCNTLPLLTTLQYCTVNLCYGVIHVYACVVCLGCLLDRRALMWWCGLVYAWCMHVLCTCSHLNVCDESFSLPCEYPFLLYMSYICMPHRLLSIRYSVLPHHVCLSRKCRERFVPKCVGPRHELIPPAR